MAKKKKGKKKKARRPPGSPPGPTVLAINICDNVVRDELTKKVSLFGLFNVIGSYNFPCTHPSMYIYLALTGGHGNHEIEVRLVRDRDQEPIMGMIGILKFASPLQVLETNLRWEKILFTEPGEYSFEVICDKMSVPIGRRKFHVIKQGEITPTSGSEAK